MPHHHSHPRRESPGIRVKGNGTSVAYNPGETLSGATGMQIIKALAIIVAILATAVAGGCSEIGEPQPVYEMFNCRELADEYTLQNPRVRQVTGIEVIRESRDELLCTGRADIELAADHEVRIQVQRLESGRVTYSVKAQ